MPDSDFSFEYSLRLQFDEKVRKSCQELFEETCREVNTNIDSNPENIVMLLSKGLIERNNEYPELVFPFNSPYKWVKALMNFSFPNWVKNVRIIRNGIEIFQQHLE